MALIDKASLLMVPSTYEDGTLYNVLPSGNKAPDETGNHNGYDQTRADFTFSRGSNLAATRVNSDGLIEKGRENLLLHSNQFDTTWVNYLASVTSGQPDKDGGSDAWLLSKSGDSGRLLQNISNTNVSTYSIYAKAGTLDWILLFVLDSSVNPRAYFDLSNGTIGTNNDIIDSNIEDVGNGWYRCSITYNKTITQVRVFPADGDNVVSGTSGNIYIQNAQLEKGLVATDVITTTSTTAQAGILEDMPRINYDANGENGALLLEPSRTNTAPISELFDQAYSTYYNFNLSPVVTTNYGTSPEGLSNSSRLDTTAANSGWYTDGQSVSSGATYTCSIFAKLVSGSESNVVRFGFSLNGDKLSHYDLSDGTIDYDHPDVTTSIQDYGNGWYRLIQTITTTSSGTLREVLYSYNDAGDYEIYGHQIEAGSHVSSYVPTHGAAVTRGADFSSDNDLTANPIEFGANDDFTLFYEGSFNNFPSSSNMLMGGGKTSLGASYKSYWWLTSATGMRLNGEGEVLMATASMSLSNNTNYKLLVKRSGSDIDFFIDGTKLSTSQGTTNTAFTFRSLGWSYTNSVYKVSGNMKQAIIFDSALTDAECISLTS